MSCLCQAGESNTEHTTQAFYQQLQHRPLSDRSSLSSLLELIRWTKTGWDVWDFLFCFVLLNLTSIREFLLKTISKDTRNEFGPEMELR